MAKARIRARKMRAKREAIEAAAAADTTAAVSAERENSPVASAESHPAVPLAPTGGTVPSSVSEDLNQEQRLEKRGPESVRDKLRRENERQAREIKALRRQIEALQQGAKMTADLANRQLELFKDVQKVLQLYPPAETTASPERIS
ncbi:hypothetical protein B0H66DRAFT_640328 [Apodospora peruviana]|uniref:Uncharacterized protein n=1 Tax=Apodospora peruviana TaxID=516989 RepID=A0AAE0I5Q8_9PEZI|nr:hypothetical protein B0H66DRAFT_640328 [Apodospora peruviana]